MHKLLRVFWRVIRAVAMELCGYCYIHGTCNTARVNGRFGGMSCWLCIVEQEVEERGMVRKLEP